MRGLLSDFFTHTRSLLQSEMDWLLNQGVPPLALARDPGEIGFAIATAKVIFGDGHFDFAEEGEEGAVAALVMAVRDEAGDVADLVAWRPKAQFVAPHLGVVAMLGQQHVGRARLGEPLLVHADPLDWLRAAREGVVVLNPARAWGLLNDAGELQVATVEHGLALRAVLQPPEISIVVPRINNLSVAA